MRERERGRGREERRWARGYYGKGRIEERDVLQRRETRPIWEEGEVEGGSWLLKGEPLQFEKGEHAVLGRSTGLQGKLADAQMLFICL